MQAQAKIFKPQAVSDDAIDPRWLSIRDHLGQVIQEQEEEMEQTRSDLKALRIIHNNLVHDFDVRVAELTRANDTISELRRELARSENEARETNVEIREHKEELRKCLEGQKASQESLLAAQLKCHSTERDLTAERLVTGQLGITVANSKIEVKALQSLVEVLKAELRELKPVTANHTNNDEDDDDDLELVLDDEGASYEDQEDDDSDGLIYVTDDIDPMEPSNGVSIQNIPDSKAAALAQDNHILLREKLELQSALRAAEKRLKLLEKVVVGFQSSNNIGSFVHNNSGTQSETMNPNTDQQEALREIESLSKLLGIYKILLEDKAAAWLKDDSVLHALWKAHFLKQYPHKGWLDPKAYTERRILFQRGKDWAEEEVAGPTYQLKPVHTPSPATIAPTNTSSGKTKSLFLATLAAASNSSTTTETSGPVLEPAGRTENRKPVHWNGKPSYDARTLSWPPLTDNDQGLNRSDVVSNVDLLATMHWDDLRDAGYKGTH